MSQKKEFQVMKSSFHVLQWVNQTGGLFYRQLERSEESYGEKGERAEWTAEKIIPDAEQLKAAKSTTERLRNLPGLEKYGATKTEMGWFLSNSDENRENITSMKREAAEILDNWRAENPNQEIRISCRFKVYEVMSDDREMIEAISDQVSETLDELKTALAAADFKQIRKTLNKVKGINELLPDDKSEALAALVENMRTQATAIRKATVKQGKSLEEVTAEIDAEPIDRAALILFDLEPTEAQEPEALEPGALALDNTTETTEDLDAIPEAQAGDFQLFDLDGPTDQEPDQEDGAALAIDETAAADPLAAWNEEAQKIREEEEATTPRPESCEGCRVWKSCELRKNGNAPIAPIICLSKIMMDAEAPAVEAARKQIADNDAKTDNQEPTDALTDAADFLAELDAEDSQPETPDFK